MNSLNRLKGRTTLVLALMLLSFTLAGHAQNNLDFLYGGVMNRAQKGVRDVATDANGNLYVTGSYYFNTDFDIGSGTSLQNGSSSEDIFVAKYNANGNLIWVRTMGGSSVDEGYKVAVGSNGDVYMLGSTISYPLYNDPGGSNEFVVGNSAGYDLVLAKYNAQGTLQWLHLLKGTRINDTYGSPEIPMGLFVDAQDRITISSYLRGDLRPDPNNAAYSIQADGDNDIVLAQYNADGTFRWGHTLGSESFDDVPSAMTGDAQGNIYVSGTWRGTELNLDPTGAADPWEIPREEQSIYRHFLVKYNANGAYQWSNLWVVDFYAETRGLATDASGDVYITGMFRDDTVRLAEGAPLLQHPNQGGSGLWSNSWALYLGRFSGSNGAHVWSKAVNGTTQTGGTAIHVNPEGKLYLASGTPDMFLNVYDLGGGYQGGFTLDGNYPDQLRGIATHYYSDINSHVVHIGGTIQSSNIDLDPGTNTYTVTSVGSQYGGYGFIAGYGMSSNVTPPPQTLFYVNASASGANTGESWANAYTSLQDAIAAVQSGDTLVVATGTYLPSTTGDVNASFELPEGVTLLGGFSGNETIDQAVIDGRNFATNTTILSGDLAGDDGAGFTNRADNSQHVVLAPTGVSAAAILNGFTISGGNASVGQGKGGGIYLAGGSPTLEHLVITDNQASESGGGINARLDAVVNASELQVHGNQAMFGAGIYIVRGGTHSISRLLATGNMASERGGAIYLDEATLNLTNATLTGNTARYGAASFMKNATWAPVNTIDWANTSTEGGFSIYKAGPVTVTPSYCLLEGSGGSGTWNTYYGTDGGNNVDGDPLFVGGNASYALYSRSPALGSGNATYGANMGYNQDAGTTLGATGIIYVDATATGTGLGDSWANAYTSLASALAIAQSGDVFYVAAGTYTPGAAGDRTASFIVPSDVSVYGGFAGNEVNINQATLDARDFTTNTTILSGDLAGDDAASFTNRTDNSYHVLFLNAVTNATVDGFTISGGQATGTTDNWQKRGAGALVDGGSQATLGNLVFTDNNAAQYGGGLMVANSSVAQVTNAVFSANQAESSGAGLCSWLATTTGTGLSFTANHALFYGAGVFQNRGTVTLRNTTLAANQSDNFKGTYYNLRGTAIFTNMVMHGNTLGSGSQHVYNQDAVSTTISFSLIQGSGGSAAWQASYGLNAGGNLDVDPMLQDPANGNVDLVNGSPALGTGNASYGTNMGYYQGSGEVKTQANTGQLADGPAATASRFVLYPNPATHNLTLEASAWAGQQVQLVVTDMAGRALVQNQLTLGQGTASLNVSTWPAGSYVITLVTASGQAHKQLLIKQ